MRVRHRTAVALSVLLVGSSALVAAGSPVAPRTTFGACDWASFRNGPGNHGASSCAGLSAQDVTGLVPRALYRTRDSVTATPAVVDDRVYVGAWDGRFYAFDAAASGIGDPSLAGSPVTTVEPLWTFDTRRLDTSGVAFGRIVSSPAIADVPAPDLGHDVRAVVFAAGATVVVLDAGDRPVEGRVLATACLDPRTPADAAGGRCRDSGDVQIEAEASPVLTPRPGGTLGITIGTDVHNAHGIGRTGLVHLSLQRRGGGWHLKTDWKFDPEGRIRRVDGQWHHERDGDTYRRGEVVDGTRVEDPLTHRSGTGQGCGGVWGTPAVDAAHDVVVFGTASCQVDTVGPDGTPRTADDPSGAVAGEKLFAVRLSDGEFLWRYDPPRPYGSRMDDDFGASPQLFEVDGRLLAGAAGKDGRYHVVDALAGPARDGQPVWRTRPGQPGHLQQDFAIGGMIGSPALGEVDGRPALFLATAISTPFGGPVEDGAPARLLDPTLAQDPGRMLSLHAVDAATGHLLWRSPVTRQTYGHPTYANGVVFVPSTASFSVQAFDADTGLPVWTSTPLNGPPSSGVAIGDGTIHVGAGTRQTDAGFKLDEGAVAPGTPTAPALGPVTDLLGRDPQQRLAGLWTFARP